MIYLIIAGWFIGYLMGLLSYRIYIRIKRDEAEMDQLFKWEDERQMLEKMEEAYQKVLMDLQESKVTNEKPINE